MEEGLVKDKVASLKMEYDYRMHAMEDIETKAFVIEVLQINF